MHMNHNSCLLFFFFFFLLLLPFVYFHTSLLSGAYLKNYTSDGYEILWVDRSHQGTSPILSPEHISKTMLATVMKLHGWIILSRRSAVHT